MAHYKSFLDQTLHYFDRPHADVLAEPLHVPAAWRGEDVRKTDNWRYSLTSSDVDEVTQALAQSKATGKSLGDLVADDFPLPSLADKFEAWRQELSAGRGFQVISGVPVLEWSQEDSERFFWCFGLHLGQPGAQNPQGDLLGHVTDTGDSADDPFVRLYRTASNIEYHCDAADVVGLLCLQKAKSGGKSRIVSSVTVYNEVLKRRPDLAPQLFDAFLLDRRNEGNDGTPGHIPIEPCRFANGTLRTFYHSDYFRSVVRHDDVPPFSEDRQALMDLYEEVAADPTLYFDMDLEPGDIQLLSNHTNLHARTDYEDWPEPGRKRHLLRLWLSLDTKH